MICLAQVLLDRAKSERQPVHPLMGSDAVQRMEDRLVCDAASTEEWRAASRNDLLRCRAHLFPQPFDDRSTAVEMTERGKLNEPCIGRYRSTGYRVQDESCPREGTQER